MLRSTLVVNLVLEESKGAVEHGHIDRRTFARSLSCDERGHDPAVTEDAGRDVRYGSTDPGRRTVRPARGIHDSRNRLNDRVVGGLTVHRTILSEAGDGADDEPRELIDQHRGRKAKLGHHSRTEVFDDDVCARDHRFDEREVVGGLQVECDALLAQVGEPEVFGRAVGGERSHQTGVVAGRWSFNLDDSCSGVRQHSGAGRPCEHAGEIDDGDAFESMRLGRVEVSFFGAKLSGHDSSMGDALGCRATMPMLLVGSVK